GHNDWRSALWPVKWAYPRPMWLSLVQRLVLVAVPAATVAVGVLVASRPGQEAVREGRPHLAMTPQPHETTLSTSDSSGVAGHDDGRPRGLFLSPVASAATDEGLQKCRAEVVSLRKETLGIRALFRRAALPSQVFAVGSANLDARRILVPAV